jgi:8-oxo-dGTP diphosphatase
MTIFVVRHAKAGQRSAWEGDDELRPLSGKGHKQTAVLTERLLAEQPTRLVSSPYVRCRETLEPIALLLDMTVELDDRLAEGGVFENTLALLDEMPDGAVLCSHGDIIPDLINALVRRGMRVHDEPDWRKASVWALERDTSGAVSDAHVWPPPTV